MVLYGFPHKLLVKLASFFLKAKSLIIFIDKNLSPHKISFPNHPLHTQKKGAAQAAALSLNHFFFRDHTLIFFISHFTAYPTRRIRKVNTLLHTTIPALPLKEAQGWSPEEGQRFLSFLWEPSVPERVYLKYSTPDSKILISCSP